jgi:hypothetical protein
MAPPLFQIRTDRQAAVDRILVTVLELTEHHFWITRKRKNRRPIERQSQPIIIVDSF